MKSVEKLCVATIVGLVAVTGGAKSLSGNGTLFAAAGDAPPVTGAPGTSVYDSGKAMQKEERGATSPAMPAAPGTPAAESSKGITITTDSAITKKVEAQLLVTKDLNSTGIKVTTKNGVVHLGGNVKNDRERLSALNAARAVQGVSGVEDEMHVSK